MGKSSPDAPQPPDYTGAAVAQGAANKEAAIATAQQNNPNVINPYGTQTWSATAPTTQFDQPGFDKARADYATALNVYNNAGGANQQQYLTEPNSGNQSLNQNYVPVPVSPSEASFNVAVDPGRPTMTQTLSPEQQALFTQQLKTQGLLGGLGEQGATSLQGVVGKPLDLSGVPPRPGAPGQIRQDVVDAYMSRANPTLDAQWDTKNSNLVAAGLRPGSVAYDRQQVLHGQARNDAMNQAILGGTAAAAQDFTQTSQARQAGLAELLAQRQVPLNEITALMSGSQVANQFSFPAAAQNAQVAPAPTYGATTQQGAYNTDLYNQQVGNTNAANQGLYGLGAAGIGAAGAAYGR